MKRIIFLCAAFLLSSPWAGLAAAQSEPMNDWGCIYWDETGAKTCMGFSSQEIDQPTFEATCAGVCQEGGNQQGCEAVLTSCDTGLKNELSTPSIRLTNPIQIDTDPTIIIGRVVSGVLGVVGALTLLVFVYGGFLWLTSAGNDEKVGTGARTMLYAAIGLFVIFGGYGILQFIISGITTGR